MMTWLFLLAMVFVGIQLGTLVLNLITFPVLAFAPRARQDNGLTVSILVPVRNEAENLPTTLPRVTKQEGVSEIIVLDDHSSDGSAQIAAGAAAHDPRVRVLSGEALPKGWNGKNWACHQLASAAKGDVLVFTDADVLWEDGTLAAVLDLQQRTNADYLSVWPRQQTHTLAERMAVPIIDLTLLSWLPYPGVRRFPHPSMSAGNGQLMLWTRKAYDAVGGHAAVRAEPLEDVRMGQRAKAAGLNITLALGGRVIRTRMYRDLPSIIEGFSKNILAAHGNSRMALLLMVSLSTLVYTLAWPLAFFESRWLLPAGLGLLQRLLTLIKTRRDARETFLQPFLPIMLWRITVRVLRHHGSYTWKGRTYP